MNLVAVKSVAAKSLATMTGVAEGVAQAIGSRGTPAAYAIHTTNEGGHRLQGSPFPAVVGMGLFTAAKARVRAWDHALERVEQTQLEQLAGILAHARHTEFGRAHGFEHIRSHADFVSRVPIGDYDSFSPAIERMRRGEANIVVPEPIRYFGNSSGSSTKGKSKFLPIGDRQIRFQQGSGSDALMRYLAHAGDPTFTNGYVLGLFPPTTMKEEGPVLITSNPALMMKKLPAVSRPLYLPDDVTRDIPDYDTKLDRIADRFMDYDVRAITGTTCWFSLLFDKLLAAARRRGRRAEHVKDLWPNLRVLIGGGVSAGPYLPILHERVGHPITLVDTYNATEGGIYAATDHSGEPGMLMIPDRGVFFEFVPLEELDKPSPTRVPLWAVEPHRNYAIVVTTPSGLYAYKLGDIVRFPSTKPLRMEFAGRLSGCLSTTQELTTHVEIEGAVEHAKRAVPSLTVDYGCGADVGVEGTSKSRYVLFVEFQDGAAPSDLEAFRLAFDEGLCKENRVYREHRSGDAAILSPRVVALPAGSVKRFMADIGNTSVQSKFPRIVDDERKERLRSYA
jgi:hypothetical protein